MFAGVDPFMDGEVALLGEPFGAHGARARSLALVFCLSTDQPYRMAISHRRVLYKGEELAPHQCREVELAPNDYILFPAALCHKCIAPESNARVIVNALLKM